MAKYFLYAHVNPIPKDSYKPGNITITSDERENCKVPVKEVSVSKEDRENIKKQIGWAFLCTMMRPKNLIIWVNTRYCYDAAGYPGSPSFDKYKIDMEQYNLTLFTVVRADPGLKSNDQEIIGLKVSYKNSSKGPPCYVQINGGCEAKVGL